MQGGRGLLVRARAGLPSRRASRAAWTAAGLGCEGGRGRLDPANSAEALARVESRPPEAVCRGCPRRGVSRTGRGVGAAQMARGGGFPLRRAAGEDVLKSKKRFWHGGLNRYRGVLVLRLRQAVRLQGPTLSGGRGPGPRPAFLAGRPPSGGGGRTRTWPAGAAREQFPSAPHRPPAFPTHGLGSLVAAAFPGPW